MQTPLSARSFAVGGVVLLCHASPSRIEARLARDLLAAVCGDWRARPARRDFAWPPKGGGAELVHEGDAGPRALAAFLDKDLSDHQAELLLVVEPLARHLPGQWSHCRHLIIPPLAELGQQADAKRRLWAAIRAGKPEPEQQ